MRNEDKDEGELLQVQTGYGQAPSVGLSSYR